MKTISFKKKKMRLSKIATEIIWFAKLCYICKEKWFVKKNVKVNTLKIKNFKKFEIIAIIQGN